MRLIIHKHNITKGGPGSGHFAHPGRPGFVGGSALSGAGLSAPHGTVIRMKVDIPWDGGTKTDDQLMWSAKLQAIRGANSGGFGSVYPKLPEEFTLGERARISDLISDGKTGPELHLRRYAHDLRDVFEKAGITKPIVDMSDDELTQALSDTRMVTLPKPRSDGHDWHSHEVKVQGVMFDREVLGEDKERLIEFTASRLAYYENSDQYHYVLMGTWSANPLTTEREANLFADRLEFYANGAPLKTKLYSGDTKEIPSYEHSLTLARIGMWKNTTNYEAFENGFAGTWASRGGGTDAQILASMYTPDIVPQNASKSFYPIGQQMIPTHSPTRVASHLSRLNEKTKTFYKEKFTTKKNPDPDLSKVALSVGRGVGGHVDSYVPAAVEPWSTDRWTPQRFGQMTSERGKYSTLTSKVSYDDILFSYETMANVPGWPPEANLKGKKEFVIFGGAHNEIVAVKHDA